MSTPRRRPWRPCSSTRPCATAGAVPRRRTRPDRPGRVGLPAAPRRRPADRPDQRRAEGGRGSDACLPGAGPAHRASPPARRRGIDSRSGPESGQHNPAMDFYGHIIDGEEVPSLDGATMDDIDPFTREPWATVALRGQGRRRPRRRGGAPGLRRGPVAADGLREAAADPAPPRRPHGRARRRTGDGRHPRHGQAHHAGAARRRAQRRGTSASSPTTRACRTAEAYADGLRAPRLLALRPGGRRRRDLAVELPAHAGHVEGGAGARVGQHRGAEARRGHPRVRDDPGPTGPRGRHPARRPQRRPRLRPRLRRAPR